MIQANELRIGNFLSIANQYIQVGSILNDAYILSNSGAHLALSSCTPIPLTPEILDKCCFVPVNAGSTFWSAFMESENKYFISAEWHNNGDLNIRDLRDSRFAVKNILYLYQLQNLIYSLTGEELTIKL